MSEKKISYLNRTFDDYRAALLQYVKDYYPSIADKFDDASIGSWLIDMVASVGDNLSYHIDRMYNETNIESASEKSSIMDIARSNGLKVPGPRPSIASEVFTCYVPVATKEFNSTSEMPMPNKAYAPVIKKGTKVSSGSQFFEVIDDIDFNELFNDNMVIDASIEPEVDGNGKIVRYKLQKEGVVYAGETKVYKQVISNSDIKPFMEILLPDENVIGVESIIFKDGVDYNSTPTMEEFMNPNEFVPASESPSNVDTYRFFEVNALAEQYRWGDDVTTTKGVNDKIGKSVSYEYGYLTPDNVVVPVYSVTKGQWIPLTQKFITEYTDNGYLKIIFGCGESAGEKVDYSNASDFSKSQISKMIRNNFLGKLPKGGMTMYIQYRVGGGASSNVPVGKINQIVYLDAEIGKCISNTSDVNIISAVQNSIRCTNNTPSISGKDAPTVDEIKNMIKYNSGAQERCVTLKDYINRITMMPSRYGTPFKIGGIEINNKIMLYLLGIDGGGKLSNQIPEQMVKNIENYLSLYRSINDFVEIKSARIINISIEVDVYIDKNYNASEVIKNIINRITEYMDINKHELGEDIYVGDIQKEISKVDGVINFTDLRIYNEYGPNYSSTRTVQPIYVDIPQDNRSEIDLDEVDYILTSDADEMFEIKYPDADIRIRAKQR